MNTITHKLKFDGKEYNIALNMWTLHVLSDVFGIEIDDVLSNVKLSGDLKFSYALLVASDDTFMDTYDFKTFCRIITPSMWMSDLQPAIIKVIKNGTPDEEPEDATSEPKAAGTRKKKQQQ